MEIVSFENCFGPILVIKQFICKYPIQHKQTQPFQDFLKIAPVNPASCLRRFIDI